MPTSQMVWLILGAVHEVGELLLTARVIQVRLICLEGFCFNARIVVL